ncbi:MAG: hypothetical protein AAGE52_40025 [Myxococcota bacterium]
MSSPRHRFVQRFVVHGTQATARESRSIDGRTEEVVRRTVPARPRAVWLRGLKMLVARLLRWNGRGLYLAPALWIVHLALQSAAPGAAVLIFVGLVVSFFALLNVFILLSAILWLVDRKGAQAAAVVFDLPPRKVIPQDAQRHVGVLRAIGPSAYGDLLWRDAWDGGTQRVAEGDDLVLEREDQPPLILELSATPEVLGRGDSLLSSELSEGARRALGLGPSERLRAIGLRVGDRVEVFVTRPAESVTLDTLTLHGRARSFHREDESAYRGGVARADLVRCNPQERLVIRRLRG